jgi:hypothetical protein
MMTREEFERQLRSLMRQRPFQPFTMVLGTGERIDVDVPEALALGAAPPATWTRTASPSSSPARRSAKSP